MSLGMSKTRLMHLVDSSIRFHVVPPQVMSNRSSLSIPSPFVICIHIPKYFATVKSYALYFVGSLMAQRIAANDTDGAHGGGFYTGLQKLEQTMPPFVPLFHH